MATFTTSFKSSVAYKCFGAPGDGTTGELILSCGLSGQAFLFSGRCVRVGALGVQKIQLHPALWWRHDT